MFVYLVIYLQMSTRGSLWREASVFAGSSRKAFAIFQKKGISLVYLQAFREYIHVIVVSAITHLLNNSNNFLKESWQNRSLFPFMIKSVL